MLAWVWPNGERAAESKCAALSRKFSPKVTASSCQSKIAALNPLAQFYVLDGAIFSLQLSALAG